MNQVILQLKIELAKKEKELKECRIKALRCINELQNANPFFGNDFNLINADGLAQAGQDLVFVKARALELQNDINVIKNQLGEQ